MSRVFCVVFSELLKRSNTMMYELIKGLSKAKGLSINQLEKTLDFSKGSLCRIDTNRPSIDKLQKIADFFGVTVDYLMTGKNEYVPAGKSELTERDRREIGRDLDKIMNEIKNKTDGPLYYNGEAIDEHSLDLLEKALELGLTELKKENKVKYGRKKKRTEA